MDAIKRLHKDMYKKLKLVSLDFKTPGGPTIPQKEISLRKLGIALSLTLNLWSFYLDFKDLRKPHY